MLNKDLEQVLNNAFKDARAKRFEFITVEHLLLVLLNNESVIDVLKACGANLPQLHKNLQEFILATTPVINKNECQELDTQPTLGFQRVLQRAVFHIQSSGKKEVSCSDVLVAIFSEQESQAVYFLLQQNISRLDVINFLAHGIAKSSEGDLEAESLITEGQEGRDGFGADIVKAYTVDLIELAKADQVDPLIGREEEVTRLCQVLTRRRKNNPLLVGEAGVGKTAIAEGLARRIIDKKVPEFLQNSKVFSLDLGALLAGTKYRGDFEKRLKKLLSALKKINNAILFIDEIHTIIGAGASSGGVMDASNLLKPILSSGKIKCIGSTTFQEFRGIFEKDRALSRRFQKIDVAEPNVDDTYKILQGLKNKFEDHHKVEYKDEALKAAAELASRYINDKFMPDKAIDVIDEVGAYQRLQPKDKRKKCIDVDDIEIIVSKLARIPSKSVSASDKQLLNKLECCLKKVIFGQDIAVSSLVNSIKLSRAGLKSPEKPVGSFLFSGPTGVGKTEVCKQLAKSLGIPLVRFDMSEYMEPHTVSRLIGAPPGYVGYDQGGLLTEAINKTPHCVLLLDELEKGHKDVFNLLLQIMDHGKITDNNGRVADFKNIILIMTTNAGAEYMDRSFMGFIEQDNSTDGNEVIKKTFSPEFRNRLDAIIPFASLNQKIMRHILNKFIDELQTQLDEKQIQLVINKDATNWLIKKGFDKKMGARPMARVIQEHLKKPMAEELLFGSLAKQGGRIVVSVDSNDKIHCKFEATKTFSSEHIA